MLGFRVRVGVTKLQAMRQTLGGVGVLVERGHVLGLVCVVDLHTTKELSELAKELRVKLFCWC